MTLAGQSEPALVAPGQWGGTRRIQPLDSAAFNTLVKTASEGVLRHEQHLKALMHQNFTVTVNSQPIQVALDIVADEDDPHALLSACDSGGSQLAKIRVRPDFKLNSTSAHAWIEGGYSKPK